MIPLYGVLVPYTNDDKNVAAVIIPVMEVASFWLNAHLRSVNRYQVLASTTIVIPVKTGLYTVV